jgi:transposase
MKPTVCPGCKERDTRITALQQQVAVLEARLRDLEDRLGRNATNSSLPPSANPPAAPPPVIKKRTGRKTGAQPGHEPHLKRLLPPERVTRIEALLPPHCARCRTLLPHQAGPDDPPPVRHQVADLPAVRAAVVEYQGHARTCPECGHVTRAAIPTAVRAHSIGPGLAATVSYLAGCHHVSQRGLEEVVETLYEIPVAVGTVANLQREMSQALEAAHAEAVAAVRRAAVKHLDETGWKQHGQRRWLWVAATATVAAFLVHARRGLEGLTALLGETIGGILCSDRWGAYDTVPVLQRQVCWAHLKRDFQRCIERGGEAAVIGHAGRRAVRKVFRAWHLFRGGGCTREELQRRLSPVARQLRGALEAGRACADRKAARFCANLLALEPALWRFVVSEGVEPTNNHAERLLRRGVLWRKNSFGSGSEAGCQFVARVLTAVQTLRLQNRPVLRFLEASLTAHRAGLAAPKLLTLG